MPEGWGGGWGQIRSRGLKGTNLQLYKKFCEEKRRIRRKRRGMGWEGLRGSSKVEWVWEGRKREREERRSERRRVETQLKLAS